MNTILKRVIALALCLVMIVGYVPATAFATETGETVTTDPTEVTTEPTQTATEETEAPSESTEATEPSTEATEPSTEATEPSAEATEPSAEATEPSTEATEPTEDTTEPTEAPKKVVTRKTLSVSQAAATSNDNIDYLFIATDRHANTSIIGNIINNMESTIGENELDYLALGGDMVGSGNNHPAYNSSTVLSEVTNATTSLSAANVDIVAGIHDVACTDDEGILMPYGQGGGLLYTGDKFYVYGVEEYCISEDYEYSDNATATYEVPVYSNYSAKETQFISAQANKFVTWANGDSIDKSKAIIVVSHYPLHVNRNDNDGAYYWHQALNSVATGGDNTVERDIVFFHGHNHTVDKNEYVYNVGDTMSIQNGSSTTSDTIYYTYATAGYLNQNSKATLVTITKDTIALDKYTTTGSGTAMTSVTRAVQEEAVTLSSIAITTAPTKTAYTVGETLDRTGMVVTATYSDGSTAAVTGYTVSDVDMTTAGPKTVTVTYDGKTATFEITVSEAETEVTEDTWYSEDTFAAVTATAESGIVTDIYDANNTTVNAMFKDADWYGYSFALEGQVADTTATITLWLPPELMTSSNLAVYYLNENGEYEPVTGYTVATDEYDVEYITITNAALGTYIYGTPSTVIPEGAVLESLKLEGPEKTKYFLTEDLENNTVYLDITGLSVTAVYTLLEEDGTKTEYPKTLDWNRFDETADGYALTFGDLTKPGEKTVTVSYNDVTAEFTVWVCAEETTSEDTGVSISFDTPSVVSVEAKTAQVTETITTALEDKLTGTLAAYDIEPTYANGDTALTGTATVTLPISGLTNPAVYYVSDNGETESMPVTGKTDTTVTFTTTHFSIYVVGDASEEAEKDLTLGSTTTTKKTVYKLTSSISSGTSYLIANSNSAGNAYVVANNSGEVDATGVTIKTDSTNGTYIELDDATDELWMVGSGYTFKNGSYYLYPRTQNSGSLNLSTDSRNWSYSNNLLSYTKSSGENKGTYYLYYSNGWDVSTASNSVYFYVPTEITVTEDTSTTYTVSASDIEHVYTYTEAEDGTVSLDGTQSETLTYALQANGKTTSFDGEVWTVAVVSDPNGIIDTANSTNKTLYFTGNTGTATMRVYYQLDANGDGDVTDDDDYKVWTTFKVTATDPYYTVDLTHNADGTGAEGTTSEYVSITDTIIIKGVEANDTYDLWAKVYKNGSTEPGTVDSAKLTWSSNNTSVATVDADGNVIFTGNDGAVQITVYYEYTNSKGEKVKATDVITFSVSAGEYYIPSDGQKDFPDYPNQGSIRIDKTATAVGNFSETGIAQVELSMTGVPYGTSTKTDVVVMVDMTSSMETNDITAAKLAVQELIESVVYDPENDVYDENIQLFVSSFSSGTSTSNIVITDHLTNVTISNAEELKAAKAEITDSTDGFRDDRHSTNGTHYGVALADVYATLTRDGHADNQFVVFVTDGVPTRYYYLNSSGAYTEKTGENSDTNSLAAGWFDDDGEVTSSFQTEYYTYLIKGMGVPVYTIGANLSDGSDASDLINHMSSNYSPDGKTSTGETKYSFTCTTSGGITDEVLEIFHNIGVSIKEAATNVVVEDKIADEYTVKFSLPSGVTADEAGMDDFYIQAVGYELDENNERKDNPTVLEKFLFNSEGTITHTINGIACGDSCNHVTKTNGVVTAIDGTYFDYKSTTDGEILTWKAEKLDRTELALQYFVYLDNSAGNVAAADQVEAGTYETNEYATITYTNHLGHECKKEFPVPSMTWKGAKVNYVFYLVNENGQPVNRAGKVIPFAEAVYVTTPVTFDVTWNEETGANNMLAENLFASANVPDVYELYDENAYYEIRVYQTEGVDQSNNVKNYNYFIIDGSDTGLTSNETTKVFNTKAGTKYDDYGVYSAQAKGSTLYTTDANNNASTVTVDYQTTDIDYANTTVAFAVVWKPELVEDTVVVDYGLDVVIDVTTNDAMAAGVTGVLAAAPSGVIINSGTYATAVGAASITSDDGVWTASKESLTSVRFHQNNMQLNKPVEFYYEAGVNYYTYDSSNNATLNTTNMYSKVTVIPATTVYYEDEYVDFDVYEKGDSGWAVSDNLTWATEGTTISATQAQDRPGPSQISAALDADNVYGYDAAYDNCSTYSLGSARYLKVDSKTYGTATFTFYGTGFDVIGLTSSDTSLLTVKIFQGAEATGTSIKNLAVDTYYGYTRQLYKVTYTYTNGVWERTVGEASTATEEVKVSYPTNPEEGATCSAIEYEWVVDKTAENALYQVPVISYEGLTYGQYTVQLKCAYNSAVDHQGDGSYKVFVDAIRIYDPTGVVSGNTTNDVVSDAYNKDGEACPVYQELRGNIIAASNVTVTKNPDGSLTATLTNGSDTIESMDGAVFIDGNAATTSISDYVSYGPNNELYLAKDQAIAFKVNLTSKSGYNIADVQLGMKSADGKAVTYTINGAAKTIETSTDMYYSIMDYAVASNGEAAVVTITNTSESILSMTNIKVTYEKAETATVDEGSSTGSEDGTDTGATDEGVSTASVDGTDTLIYTDEAVVTYSLMSMRPAVDEEVPETTEPETSEPETSEPETSEPETSEPETTVPEETEPEETVPETTEPDKSEQEQIEEAVKEAVTTIINTVVNTLKNLFSKWFR